MSTFLYIGKSVMLHPYKTIFLPTKRAQQINKGNKKIHNLNLKPRDVSISSLCLQIMYWWAVTERSLGEGHKTQLKE